jgi:hypothetical protein
MKVFPNWVVVRSTPLTLLGSHRQIRPSIVLVAAALVIGPLLVPGVLDREAYPITQVKAAFKAIGFQDRKLPRGTIVDLIDRKPDKRKIVQDGLVALKQPTVKEPLRS